MIKSEYGNATVNHLCPVVIANRYHAEKLTYNLDDNNLNISILGKRIAPFSSVLDVACGEGKFAHLYREKRIKAWGVDLDPESVKQAQKSGAFQDVFCCDVEKEFEKLEKVVEEQIGDRFDYIIMCDVLEHFINPTQVLMKFYTLLKPGGKIMISIPNVGNADIFLNLLEGNFNYAREGILDNTHFHFFTKKSFAEWIDEINSQSPTTQMDCLYLGGTYGVTKYLEKVEKNYPLIYQLIQYNPQYQVVQLLFELSEKQKETKENLLKLLSEDNRVLEQIERTLAGKYETALQPVIEQNERMELKREIEILNAGWKKCNNQLKDVQQLLEKTQTEWKLQNTLVQKLSNDLEKNKKGWIECNKQLTKTESALNNAEVGWKVCDEKLQEKEKEVLKIKSEWELCNSRLIQCTEELQNAKNGWELCNQRLIEEQKNLKIAMNGWKVCNDELERIKKELAEEKMKGELS